MKRSEREEPDYAALAEFRYLIRCFLEFSEIEARKAGLRPRHHQALLAIKGYGRGRPIPVSELAERLRIRHNTAVELADRLVAGGLVERQRDPTDQRRALLELTETAERHLAQLSNAHLEEIARIGPLLDRTFRRAGSERRIKHQNR